MRLVDKETSADNWYFDIGMIDRATFMKQGICRRMKAGSGIWEGMYQNDQLNGFGRCVYDDGQAIMYYSGMWEND